MVRGAVCALTSTGPVGPGANHVVLAASDRENRAGNVPGQLAVATVPGGGQTHTSGRRSGRWKIIADDQPRRPAVACPVAAGRLHARRRSANVVPECGG